MGQLVKPLPYCKILTQLQTSFPEKLISFCSYKPGLGVHPDEVHGLSGLPPGEHLAGGGGGWPRLGLAQTGSCWLSHSWAHWLQAPSQARGCHSGQAYRGRPGHRSWKCGGTRWQGPCSPAGCPQRWRRDRREGSGCLASSAAVTDATNSGSGAWRSELQVPQGWPLPGLAPWPSPHVAPPPHPVTSPHLCHLLEGPSPQTVTLG